MKTRTNLLAIGVVGLLSLGAPRAQAVLEVSAGVSINATADFYTPLSSCGTWVEVGSYGRCWRPVGVVVSWRPYCEGTWVWTDCGWYWESDEPWAWACYHYGSWVYDSSYGWIWVPGVEWAPAWVCWRFGGGYIGWAPLPPRGVFFGSRPVDATFVFVDNGHFGGRISSSTVIVNNTTIIERTKFISNTERATREFGGSAHKVVVNDGPGLAAVERATGKKFSAISVRDADRRTPMPSGLRHSAVPTGNGHQPNAPAPGKTYAPPSPNPGTSPGGQHNPPSGREPGQGPGGGSQGGQRYVPPAQHPAPAPNPGGTPSKERKNPPQSPDQGGSPGGPPDGSSGRDSGQGGGGEGGGHGHGHAHS